MLLPWIHTDDDAATNDDCAVAHQESPRHAYPLPYSLPRTRIAHCFSLNAFFVLLFSGWPRKCIIDYMDLLLKAG